MTTYHFPGSVTDKRLSDLRQLEDLERQWIKERTKHVRGKEHTQHADTADTSAT